MTTDLSLPEELLLLCLDDETGRSCECWLDYGLNGAVLAELFLRDRLRLDEKQRVLVQNASPTGDPLLDRALARIGESGRAHPLAGWAADLFRGRPSGRDQLLAGLVDRGILRAEEDRFLWVFPRTDHPTQDPRPESELRDRLRGAVMGGGSATERLAALLAVLQGSDALDRVFTREELAQHRNRIRQLAACGDGARAGTAVRDAVTAVSVAIGTAIMVSASTSVVASS